MVMSVALAVLIVTCGFVCLPDVTSGGEREIEKTTVADPPGGQQDLAGVPGQVLIQKLLDTNSCSSAFYELWRRNKRDKDAGYQSFLENHYDPWFSSGTRTRRLIQAPRAKQAITFDDWMSPIRMCSRSLNG
jgi:hypothetical protein